MASTAQQTNFIVPSSVKRFTEEADELAINLRDQGLLRSKSYAIATELSPNNAANKEQQI